MFHSLRSRIQVHPWQAAHFPNLLVFRHVLTASLMSRRGALWAAALLAILHLWLLAETLSLRVPLWHIDGAFQTASALFRLDQGQLPGRDFMPYLGIAAAYILFPFYKLAGGDLAATTTAAFFVVFVFAVTGMATLTKLVFPRASFPAATAVAVLIVLLLLPIVLSERLPIKAADLLGWPLQPGHSLRPVRAFAPVLTALAIFLVARELPVAEERAVLVQRLWAAERDDRRPVRALCADPGWLDVGTGARRRIGGLAGRGLGPDDRHRRPCGAVSRLYAERRGRRPMVVLFGLRTEGSDLPDR
jgi:hypothetical protein